MWRDWADDVHGRALDCGHRCKQRPTHFLVVSGGLIRFADPDNPADYNDVQFEDDQVEFRDVAGGKVDNRLTNIGPKAHRNFVVELKGG